VAAINAAAEKVSPSAEEHILAAIEGLDYGAPEYGDILENKEALTNLLSAAAEEPVKAAVGPALETAVNEDGGKATWDLCLEAYNAIPGVEDVQLDLQQYTLEGWYAGVFKLIAEEEESLREDLKSCTEAAQAAFKDAPASGAAGGDGGDAGGPAADLGPNGPTSYARKLQELVDAGLATKAQALLRDKPPRWAAEDAPSIVGAMKRWTGTVDMIYFGTLALGNMIGYHGQSGAAQIHAAGAVEVLRNALRLYSDNGGVICRILFTLKAIARRGGEEAFDEVKGLESDINDTRRKHSDNKGLTREAESLLQALNPEE